MSKKAIKYQCLEYNFPEFLYAYFPFYQKPDIDFNVYISRVLFSSVESVSLIAKKIYGHKLIQKADAVLDGSGMLLTLSYLKKHPLKKEFWNYNVLKADYDDRFIMYANYMIKNKEFYNVFVMPQGTDEMGEVRYILGSPISLTMTNKEIDQQLMMSDDAVDEKATHAGIYKLIDILGLNWKTGEVYGNNLKN